MDDLENKHESESMSRSERVLISIALFMFAIVVGYNAFYIFEYSETPKISGNIVTPKNETETNITESNDTEKSEKGDLININTASAEELKALKRVGDSIAERIIEYRESHGGFSSIEEIMNVKGIGEKTFEEIKDRICV